VFTEYTVYDALLDKKSRVFVNLRQIVMVEPCGPVGSNNTTCVMTLVNNAKLHIVDTPIDVVMRTITDNWGLYDVE
jgi:hypothetical protein